MKRRRHTFVAAAALTAALGGLSAFALEAASGAPMPGVMDARWGGLLRTAEAGADPQPGMALGDRQGAGSGGLSFVEIDENGDERISEKELHRARAARIVERAQRGEPLSGAGKEPTFDDMDLNGDRLIDRNELAVSQHRQPKTRLEPSTRPPESSQPRF